MSEARWEHMPPGSDEAVARGCLCPRFDNARGRGAYYGARPGGMFWVDAHCPLHGGLPGTGAGVTPENAPSREGDAAPGPECEHVPFRTWATVRLDENGLVHFSSVGMAYSIVLCERCGAEMSREEVPFTPPPKAGELRDMFSDLSGAAPGPDYTNGCAKCGKRTCDESCCDVCSDPQCQHNNQPL